MGRRVYLEKGKCEFSFEYLLDMMTKAIFSFEYLLDMMTKGIFSFEYLLDMMTKGIFGFLRISGSSGGDTNDNTWCHLPRIILHK